MSASTSDISVLVQRIETLEKKCRWLRWASASWLVVLALVVVGAILFAIARFQTWGRGVPSDIAVAKSFVVRESGGKPRAHLALDYDTEDGTSLLLTDRHGNERFFVFVRGDEAVLQFSERAAGPSIWFQADKKATGIVLKDDKNRKRAELAIEKEGPVFRLLAEDGTPIFAKP